MVTSKDFEALYGEIQRRTNETVGVSTLKRIWGYIGGYRSVRVTTLDVLCRFVGVPDWHTFVADCCNVESEQSSHRVITSTVSIEQIGVGWSVEIEWNPGRRLLLTHCGGGMFEVKESHKSKVVAGDTFHCDRFIIGLPLYMDNFIHDNQPPVLFVVGKKGGLTKVKTIANI